VTGPEGGGGAAAKFKCMCKMVNGIEGSHMQDGPAMTGCGACKVYEA
jgi:hypothetical protein